MTRAVDSDETTPGGRLMAADRTPFVRRVRGGILFMSGFPTDVNGHYSIARPFVITFLKSAFFTADKVAGQRYLLSSD